MKANVYTLRSGNIEAEITNFGARIMALRIDGIDVVQGFDTVEDYLPENHKSDFGAVIGRYANRLAGGRIAIDGDVIQLPQNNGPNCLHGGPDGWQYKAYDVLEATDTCLRLALVSPDGDNGFPGTVKVLVAYTLSADGALRIDYHAETDRTTVINMTNHSYFNLGGDLSASIHDHILRIGADRYTPIDEVSIPLGEHVPVEGTPFDFRTPKPIGRDIDADDPQLRIGRGYDHNFVLNQGNGPQISLMSPATGITLDISTDAPGVQLYTGNFLDGVRGKGGIGYPVRSAVCLETQLYPDSPNHRWPESTGYLMPDRPFSSTTIFRLGRAAAYAAPGRINLIGEHTDYNGGFVFPGAVVQGITARIRPNGTREVRLVAADLGRSCSFSIDDPEGPQDTNFRYVYGVVREMMAAGVQVQGFDAVYGGDVPLGAGMSSSAALESCFAFALNDLFGGSLSRMEMARIGQATEHKYVGVKCGIMDQFASMHGQRGKLMRLDCRSGEFRYYPWNPVGYSLVLINTCVKHELVGSPYNERRASCERVAAAAGVETLRDCTWEQLEALRPQLSDEDYRRARYVLGEADRVMRVCEALERGDYETVGRQMYLTHEGLSQDYEVSCPELDFLVDEARRMGVSGARMMGGGFGGCTINLVRDDIREAFLGEVQRTYRQRFGIDCKPIAVEIGDGARRLS